MTFTDQTKLTPRVNARLSTYAALAGAALAGPALASTANAAIVNSGPINLVVPNNADGIYLNFLTGATGTTSAAVPGFDWNPYLQNAVLTFFWNNTAPSVSGGVAATANGVYLALNPSTVVGPSSLYSASAGGGGAASSAAFQVTGTETLGIRFYNEATAAINYGYVVLKTTATNGFPATVVSYSYENTGASITTPSAVPEPTTTAALGLGAMALGAAGVRRWRRGKQALA